MSSLSGRTLYEVLEIPRSATTREVLQAYERARALFGPGSLASYALLSPDDAEALARRIEEARTVLLDPQARARYDGRLPPEKDGRSRAAAEPGAGPPHDAPPSPPEGTTPATAGSLASTPTIPATPAAPAGPPPGEPWTGFHLRQAREARGLTILQVCERTKVQRTTIESIEADRLDQLPPPVYLRGILASIAGALRLDAATLARSYLEHAAAARAPGRDH